MVGAVCLPKVDQALNPPSSPVTDGHVDLRLSFHLEEGVGCLGGGAVPRRNNQRHLLRQTTRFRQGGTSKQDATECVANDQQLRRKPRVVWGPVLKTHKERAEAAWYACCPPSASSNASKHTSISWSIVQRTDTTRTRWPPAPLARLLPPSQNH